MFKILKCINNKKILFEKKDYCLIFSDIEKIGLELVYYQNQKWLDHVIDEVLVFN